MSSDIELPERYSPFPNLAFCSNELVGGKVPISVRNFPVLLVGRGIVPLLWLAAPSEPGSKSWTYVVRESQSANPAIRVSVEKEKGVITVYTSGQEVVKARTITSERAEVSYLDLRPLGLAIEGNTSALRVSGMTLSNNTFRGLQTAFAFG